MNLFGPHIHRPGMGLDLLGRGRFAAALAMDVDSAYIREARQRSPDTILVVRVYEDGAQFLEWSPEAWVARLLAKFPTDKPDYFVTINEPFGHDSSELFERFDIWESEVAGLLQANGTDGLCCNFGTGNFTSGPDRVRIPDVFPRICGIANAMGPHDYSWGTLEAGWGWYAGRWFAWHSDILAATGKEMKFLVGECGLTQAVIAGREDWGWQSESPENVTAESYLATLRQYLERVVAWDAGRGIVLGLCIFNWYDQFHWSFEHIDKPEVVDAIIGMDVPTPPPPEPPPEEEPMDIRVVDLNYQERDLQYAKDKYGVAFRRAVVAPGQLVWRLTELWEATGHHSLITQALDEDGKPMANVDVTFYWSGAPDPPEPPTTVYLHDWYRNFVHGLTNVNGDVGPGMGSGAWIDVDPEPPHHAIGGGPHAVWIHDPDIPSDICEKLGMRGGTNHDHLDQKFKLMIEGEENGNGNGDVVLVPREILVEDYHEAALAIAYPADVAIDTRGDGRGPGVDEDIHPKSWDHPTLGTMAMVEMCCDFEGAEPRIYTLRVYRMSDGASLTNTEAESFQPLGFPRKRVIYVYVKDDPDDPDEPTDGDLLVEVVRIRVAAEGILEHLTGTPPEPPPTDKPFRGEYYDNKELAGTPVLIRDDPKINFRWGEDTPPGPGVPTDNFSVRWTTDRTFEAGTYRFYAFTDDGVRVWVDDILIIDKWTDHAPTQYDAQVALTAGLHSIKMEFYEHTGGATAMLWWDKVSVLARLWGAIRRLWANGNAGIERGL